MPAHSDLYGRWLMNRLGWIRLGYGEMTEEVRVPSDHLEFRCSFAPVSTEIGLVLMTPLGRILTQPVNRLEFSSGLNPQVDLILFPVSHRRLS